MPRPGSCGERSVARRADIWQSYRGRRVLVTGHTGFKGSWLTAWLLHLGADVAGYALDDPVSEPSLFNILNLTDRCRDQRGDIRDDERLRRYVSDVGPDVVFHLAAQPLVRQSYRAPRETFEINVQGTANLLQAIRGLDSVAAVVAVTSDKCYRNDGSGRAFSEDEPLGGDDPYSASKAAAELVVHAYRALNELPPLASARAGNVIGGGDWAEDRLLPDVARAFAHGRPVEVRNPTHRRPWQYVLDCLAGYLSLGHALLTRGQDAAGAYNFGPDDTEGVTVRRLVELTIDSWPEGSWLDLSEAQSGGAAEAPVLLLDSTKARTTLSWQERYGIEQAVARSAAWYRSHAAGADMIDESAAEIAAYTTRRA